MNDDLQRCYSTPRLLVKPRAVRHHSRRMYFLDILFNSHLLLAMAGYGVLAALEPFFSAWLVRVFENNPPALWSWETLGVPLVRAALVLGFVYFSYPALFGLRAAPDLATLMAANEAKPSVILGLLYLLALIAPVLPVFHAHRYLILPLQGMLATGFLFRWMTGYLSMTAASLWPGIEIALAVVLTSYLAHRLGAQVGYRLGASLDHQTNHRGYDALLTHVITLEAQLPIIVIYAAGLGRQIAI